MPFIILMMRSPRVIHFVSLIQQQSTTLEFTLHRFQIKTSRWQPKYCVGRPPTPCFKQKRPFQRSQRYLAIRLTQGTCGFEYAAEMGMQLWSSNRVPSCAYLTPNQFPPRARTIDQERPGNALQGKSRGSLSNLGYVLNSGAG